MKTKTTIAVASIAMAHSALGQGIYVEAYNPQTASWTPLSGFPNRIAGEPGLVSGSDLTISHPGDATIRIFSDEPATTDIGLVTIVADDTEAPTIFISRPATPDIDPSAPAGGRACRALGGILASGQSRIQVFTRTITGPGIEAHEIVRLDILDDLDAPVIHWGDLASPSPKLGAIEVGGNITPQAPIAAYTGGIGSIHTGQDLNATVVSRDGGIESIMVDGNLGSAGRPVIYASAPRGTFALDTLIVNGTIGTANSTVDIDTAGSVRLIEADEIFADIDLELEPSQPGFLAGLTTRTGDFSGSLVARSLTGFGGWSVAPCKVSIAGDLNAAVRFVNGIRNENPSGPEIDIAGSLTTYASITTRAMFRNNPSLPAGEIRIGAEQGLAGQIVIGSGNINDFPEPATVTVGSTNPFVITQNSRFYPDSFDSMGGGAIGIAPFNFHATESFPKHNELIELDAQHQLVRVVVRLYGPAFVEAAPIHMIVEHLPEGSSTWVDRSTDFYLEATESELDASRELVVHALTGQRFDAGQWRLRPAPGTVKCALAKGNPDVVFDSEYADDTYRFSVTGGSDCPAPGGLSTPGDQLQSDIEAGIILVPCP